VIQDLVVEIFVPECGTNGEEGQFATGYPIARDRILTARHPLFPAPGRDPKHPIEIRWRCRDVDPCWRPVGDIVWEDQGWDLALLACTLPEHIDHWGAFLSEERPVPNAQWYSVGFPRVGGKRDGVRESFGTGGSIKADIDRADRFDVDETAGPEDADAWKGVSGSPVFVDSRIFGVIVSVPKDVKARRLSAVPIWRLLREAPDFCEQIGYQQRKDRREALEHAVCAALGPAPDAVRAVAKEIPGLAADLEGLSGPERAATLARRLLGLEIDQVVVVADRAYRKLAAAQPEAAQAIADAVRAILPAVYDHGVVETVRSACGDVQAGLLALPAYHHTVAEIIMAGADRRPLELCARRDDNHFPKGRLRLPEPPECGFDEDGRQAMAAIEEHLARKLTLDPDQAQALERAVDGFMIARFAARSMADAKRSDAKPLPPAKSSTRPTRAGRIT
jgi:hypothetical protein